MRLLVEDVICDRERVTIRTIIPADKVGEDAVLCTPIRGGRVGKHLGWGSRPSPWWYDLPYIVSPTRIASRFAATEKASLI